MRTCINGSVDIYICTQMCFRIWTAIYFPVRSYPFSPIEFIPLIQITMWDFRYFVIENFYIVHILCLTQQYSTSMYSKNEKLNRFSHAVHRTNILLHKLNEDSVSTSAKKTKAMTKQIACKFYFYKYIENLTVDFTHYIIRCVSITLNSIHYYNY